MDSERVEAHDDFGHSPNLGIELYKLITESGHVNKNLLSGLITRGTEQGCVTYDQVNKVLKKEHRHSADPSIDTTLDNIIQYLNFKDVDIVEEIDASLLSPGKSAQKCLSPNQLYNRDIRAIEMLGYKKQIELGKSIFVFKRQLIHFLCSSEFSPYFIGEMRRAYSDDSGSENPVHKRSLRRGDGDYSHDMIRECLYTIDRIDKRITSLYHDLRKARSRKARAEIEKRIELKQNNRQRILSSFDYKHEVINKAVDFLNKNKKGYNRRRVSFINKLHENYKKPLDLLVASNLRLVIKYARRYFYGGLYEELLQEGNEGLITAADDFDYRMNIKFSTYATIWIKQKISRYFKDHRWAVRIPIHVHDVYAHIKKAVKAYEIKHGSAPSKEVLASKVGISVSELQRVISRMKAPVSIDKVINDEDDTNLGAFISDPSSENPVREMEKTMLKERMAEVLDSLDAREKEIIKLRYGVDGRRAHTLEEVGKIFGVTRERARQIEAKAIRKLQHPCRSKSLELFLDSASHNHQTGSSHSPSSSL